MQPEHFLSKQKKILSCGDFVCAECITHDGPLIVCSRCGEPNTLELEKFPVLNFNYTRKHLNANLVDFSRAVEAKLESTLNQLKETLTYVDDKIESRFKMVEWEIEHRTNILKCRLDKLCQKLKKQLTDSKQHVKSVAYDAVDDLTMFEAELYNYGNDIQQNAIDVDRFYEINTDLLLVGLKLRDLKNFEFKVDFLDNRDCSEIFDKDLIGSIDCKCDVLPVRKRQTQPIENYGAHQSDMKLTDTKEDPKQVIADDQYSFVLCTNDTLKIKSEPIEPVFKLAIDMAANGMLIKSESKDLNPDLDFNKHKTDLSCPSCDTHSSDDESSLLYIVTDDELSCTDSKSDDPNKIKTKKARLNDNLSDGPKCGEWTKDETIFLVYGIKNFGIGLANWPKILDKYAHRFSYGRTYDDCQRKYDQLKRNKKLNQYERLVDVHGSVIDDLLARNEYIGCVYEKLMSVDPNKHHQQQLMKNASSPFVGKTKPSEFSNDEYIFLIYGVKTIGHGRWPVILEKFKSRFAVDRTFKCLKDKYNQLQLHNYRDLKVYKNLVEKHSNLIGKILATNDLNVGSVFEQLNSIGKNMSDNRNTLVAIKSNADKPSKRHLSSTEIKYKDWKQDEDIFLVYGVRRYGSGEWDKILNKFSSRFAKGRSPKCLNERYQQIQHSTNIKRLVDRHSNFIYNSFLKNEYVGCIHEKLEKTDK